MAYFLSREDGRQPVGGRSRAGRPPPVPCSFDAGNQRSVDQGQPTSPLSRFVQDGYVPGGMIGAPSQQGFDAGIAQQWNSNVQQTRATHQQQNDPNYIEKQPKSHGYRVSQAPGGGSSISLSWDEAPGGAMQAGRRGRGASPSHAAGGSALGSEGLGGGAWGIQGNGASAGSRAQHRAPSPSAPGRNAAGFRGSSREPGGGGMASCLGGGAMPSNPSSRGSARAASPGGVASCMSVAAYDSRAAPSYGAVQYGGAGNFAMPPPPQPAGGRNDRMGNCQSEATGLSFGNRIEKGSSNSYASGANQNCGNGITDRRMTRVLQPPGGGSQISFG